jgi:hypothetical protein
LGTTELGLRYADSNSAATLWTHFQNLAADVNTYVMQRVANKAARLALTGVNVGRLVPELDTGRLWGRSASGWMHVASPPGSLLTDTTATTPGTTGITPGAGFTLGLRSLRNLGNGTAYVMCIFSPTGAATVGATGDLGNVTCFNVPAAWAPAVDSPLTILGTGRMLMGYLGTDRTATWSATTPGGNIAAGDSLQLAGIYPLADPSAV